MPGSRAVKKGQASKWNLSLYTPVIVKYRDEKTDASAALDTLLKECDYAAVVGLSMGALVALLSSALLAATRIKTELAHDMRTALIRLREQEFSAVVIDESLLEPSAKSIDMLVKHLGRAVPVFVNLAVSRMERVVRDIQAALLRAEKERSVARQAVEFDLRGELRGELTGILLWTQQALELPALPAAAESKLKSVYETADKIRERLGVAS